MNKQVMIGVSVGLLLLAVLIFAFTHKSGASDADMSAEMNKPRPGGPTFAPDVPVQSGGRNAKGMEKGSSAGAPGGAGAPP